VTLADGRTVQGLRRGSLGSYRAFRAVAALQGVFVRLHDLENRPRAWQQADWLQRIAAAVQAGQDRPRGGHAR
jgi:hypothetical protein